MYLDTYGPYKPNLVSVISICVRNMRLVQCLLQQLGMASLSIFRKYGLKFIQLAPLAILSLVTVCVDLSARRMTAYQWLPCDDAVICEYLLLCWKTFTLSDIVLI